ncbi:MAG TPA: DUF4296 domain-containing protein [Bacteroidia bacterium]
MLRSIAAGLILLFVVSCNGPKEVELPPPADLLDKPVMAAVMTDLALAESVITLKTIQEPAFNPDSTVKFNVFKQHNISRKQYENNILWYSQHPKDFKEVYDIVAKTLEDMNKR